MLFGTNLDTSLLMDAASLKMLPKLARKKISMAPGFPSYEGRTLPDAPTMDDRLARMGKVQKSAKTGLKRHFSALVDAPNDASQLGLYNPIGTNIWNKKAQCKKSGFFIPKKFSYRRASTSHETLDSLWNHTEQSPEAIHSKTALRFD
jgi:hypothetical protein